MKKLLTNDYQNMVAESFRLPIIDFHNYYSNIIDEFASTNDDIFQRLYSAIDHWKFIYTLKVDRSITWEEDEEGNKTFHNPFDTYINLTFLDLSINREVNRAFFEHQTELLKGIQLAHEAKTIIQSYRPEVTIKHTLTYKEIFKPEHRYAIPELTLKYLGPGQADAWEPDGDMKKWKYNGTESAIMIPFFWLVNNGFIKIDSRKKKFFISAWLKEFGVSYKDRTFDNVPKSSHDTQYFDEYMSKLINVR